MYYVCMCVYSALETKSVCMYLCICMCIGSHFLYVKIGTDISHRRIEVFPGMLHEVFHDTHEEGRSSAKCIAMVVDYCDAHLKLLL